MPARQSVVNDVSESKGFGLMSASFNVSRIIGPMIAAAIISKFDVKWCYFINALSFIWILCVIHKLDLTKHKKIQNDNIVPKELKAFIPYAILLNLFAWALVPLLPYFASKLNSGPQGLANLTAAFGIGAIIASFLCNNVKNERLYSIVLFAMIAVSGSLFAISANLANFKLCYICIALVGAGIAGFTVLITSYLHHNVSKYHLSSIRGQASTLYSRCSGFSIFGHFLTAILLLYFDCSTVVIFMMSLFLILSLLFIPKNTYL